MKKTSTEDACRAGAAPGWTLLLCLLVAALPGRSLAGERESLLAQHDRLRASLASNAFQRPIHLESRQQGGKITGDVYARVAQTYGDLAPALTGGQHWCDILILHLNVKRCVVSGPGGAQTLRVHVGRKLDQPLGDAFPLQFAYRVATARGDYLRVELLAPSGPMGTRDYQIVLEATPLQAGGSFLHLSYASTYGVTARAATRGYLATAGRSKVGFSVLRRQPDGSPVYVRGMRALMERNTMRYYLAVQAYLDGQQAPAPLRMEQCLSNWYAAAEVYAVQLHEMERDDYMGMKRSELRRQRAAQRAVMPP